MTFPHVNDSVQVGDMVYYQVPGGAILQMGLCTATTSTTVSCDIPATMPLSLIHI